MVDNHFVFPPAPPQPALQPATPPNDQQETCDQLKLRFATYNVATLGECEHSRPQANHGFPCRGAYLRHQVRQEQISIIGIQEARTAEAMLELDGFLVIASGAQQGRLGVELWIDLQKPYLEQKGKQHFSKRTSGGDPQRTSVTGCQH